MNSKQRMAIAATLGMLEAAIDADESRGHRWSSRTKREVYGRIVDAFPVAHLTDDRYRPQVEPLEPPC